MDNRSSSATGRLERSTWSLGTDRVRGSLRSRGAPRKSGGTLRQERLGSTIRKILTTLQGQSCAFRSMSQTKCQTVWSSSIIQALPSFQLSRDGKLAASTFPWPSSGVAELPDVAWRKHRDGCWPSMAPDDSYISWTFDGPHRNLFMTQVGQGRVLDGEYFPGSGREGLRGLPSALE